ncbi:uncharacterized protein LOC107024841 [Solanum pennellii]|uniref:Uncharacterized protein LOC107024841 n=1 Tax=Solanum pennellii TaxID=28526 RepID=A0ABM1H728_SOLPN|nr:uncharacterized protein LOC107024841 [Solanum pennellii]
MNTRRNAGQGRGGATAGGNQVPPQVPDEGVAIPVNPDGLTDAEVRTALAQIAQAITMQAQAVTAQANIEDVQWENPPEFMDEVHKILVSKGATDTEKPKLASYRVKDVAQSWSKMWQDSRPLGGVLVMRELFKTAFLERFFLREMREAKVEEFINLKQGSMTIREYSLKFVKITRYATSVVSKRRNEISRFLTGIMGDLEEECPSTKLHDNKDLSRLIVHVKLVEDSRKRRGVCDIRRPKPFDQAGPINGGTRTTLASVSSPNSKRRIRVRGTLTFRV